MLAELLLALVLHAAQGRCDSPPPQGVGFTVPARAGPRCRSSMTRRGCSAASCATSGQTSPWRPRCAACRAPCCTAGSLRCLQAGRWPAAHTTDLLALGPGGTPAGLTRLQGACMRAHIPGECAPSKAGLRVPGRTAGGGWRWLAVHLLGLIPAGLHAGLHGTLAGDTSTPCVQHAMHPACCVPPQDAMKRLTLDSFLPAGGFGFELNALDFAPCQVLRPQVPCTAEVGVHARRSVHWASCWHWAQPLLQGRQGNACLLGMHCPAAANVWPGRVLSNVVSCAVPEGPADRVLGGCHVHVPPPAALVVPPRPLPVQGGPQLRGQPHEVCAGLPLPALPVLITAHHTCACSERCGLSAGHRSYTPAPAVPGAKIPDSPCRHVTAALPARSMQPSRQQHNGA